MPDAPEDCPCLQFACSGTVLTFHGIHRQADQSPWPVRVIVAVRALYRVSPAARHEAEQPTDGCDDEEDDAYPQQPVQGLREAAHQQKDNCNYTSNDQKRVHGQHIPFWGNPQRIFWIPDYAFLFTSIYFLQVLGSVPPLPGAFIAITSGPHRGVEFARCEQRHSSLYY